MSLKKFRTISGNKSHNLAKKMIYRQRNYTKERVTPNCSWHMRYQDNGLKNLEHSPKHAQVIVNHLRTQWILRKIFKITPIFPQLAHMNASRQKLSVHRLKSQSTPNRCPNDPHEKNQKNLNIKMVQGYHPTLSFSIVANQKGTS